MFSQCLINVKKKTNSASVANIIICLVPVTIHRFIKKIILIQTQSSQISSRKKQTKTCVQQSNFTLSFRNKHFGERSDSQDNKHTHI